MTDSKQLERETESCRDQLSDTLDELRMRLTPGEVVDQLVDYAQDTTGGLFFQNLKQDVAGNPLPVALIGAGFAWLMCGKAMNASKIRHGAASFAQRGRGWLSEGADAAAAARRDASGRINEATDRVPETAGSTAAESRERMRAGTAALSDATTDAASRANEAMRDAAAAAGTAFGDTVSATYERAAAGAGRTASAVSDSASRIGNSAAASGRDLMDFCRDQPLVLAGLGLAVGAAIGAFLPRTQAEDQFMGGVSDELKEQGRGFAGEQFEKAKKVGERAFDAAQEEADRQGLAGEAVAKEAASKVERTSIAPSSEADADASGQTGNKGPEPVHERR